MSYRKGERNYELGTRSLLPEELVKGVDLTGKRGKALTVTFRLETEHRHISLEMVLAPLCYRKNKFYPLDLLQEAACAKALEAAEKLAERACGLTPAELEAGRLKSECGDYGLYAAMVSFLDMAIAASGEPVPAAICFAATLTPFGMIIARKRLPKLSLLVVIVEALLAYNILGM